MPLISNHPSVPADAVQAMSEELDRLLTQQIACAREGDLDQVERLAARTETLVAAIASREAAGLTMAASHRVRLRQRYDELTLVLRAERSDVQTKLRQVRQVKRAVGSYRHEATPSPSHQTVFDDGTIH